MRDELKTALDKITADEALRQSTRAFLARQTGDYGAAKARPRVRRMAAAFACLALVIAGGTGYWAYFSPTCAISVDILRACAATTCRAERRSASSASSAPWAVRF